MVTLGISLLSTSLLGGLKNRIRQTQLVMTPGKYFLLRKYSSENDGSKTCYKHQKLLLGSYHPVPLNWPTDVPKTFKQIFLAEKTDL